MVAMTRVDEYFKDSILDDARGSKKEHQHTRRKPPEKKPEVYYAVRRLTPITTNKAPK